MKRRITPRFFNEDAYKAAIDHKEAALQVILGQIKNTSTFADLGELVGYSHEWVRERLVKKPERLYKIGNRYQVPKGVAEEFIRSVYA